MVARLRDAMREILEGWQADLDSAWQNVLGPVVLGFDDVAPELELEPWEPVFPTRRGRTLPGAPAGAHMLRAFDGLAPSNVKVLILGQDPYPCPAFATGRAFEAGNVARWRELEKMFSCSMRTLLQMIAVARTGEAAYGSTIGEWRKLIDDIEAGRVAMPDPPALIDSWVAEGVLLLNSSLTLSRFKVEGDPHQVRGHLPLWRPLIMAAIRHLAARPGQPLVLIAFGSHAADVFRACGLITQEDGLVEGHHRICCIVRDHPARGDAVLSRPNPFQTCNQLLARMSAAPIAW